MPDNTPTRVSTVVDSLTAPSGRDTIELAKTFKPKDSGVTAAFKAAFGIGAEGIPTGYLDTDGTLAANSDTKVATQKAVRTFIATQLAGLAENKGALNCGSNPNYPSASNGDFYRVSVAGKVGGSSGTVVEIGDVVMAVADNAGGTQGSVGSSWIILQANVANMTAAGLAMLQAADAAAQLALLPIASQAEAEAGTENTKRMTPLRVAQAIAALGSAGGGALSLGASADLGDPATPIFVDIGGYTQLFFLRTLSDPDERFSDPDDLGGASQYQAVASGVHFIQFGIGAARFDETSDLTAVTLIASVEGVFFGIDCFGIGGAGGNHMGMVIMSAGDLVKFYAATTAAVNINYLKVEIIKPAS